MDHFNRRAVLGLAGLMMGLGGAAQGQPPADTAANWLKKPTSQEMESFYPNEAAVHGASGTAGINCTVAIDGSLRNCAVTGEAPAGMGFAAAALAMAAQFRMKPATRAGQPVESSVRIPIRFDVPASMITEPDWLKKPTDEEIYGTWPVAAAKAGKGGHATLRCEVTVDGLVNHCLVIEETPTGLGFGAAALSMTTYFLMKPTVKDGVPFGGGSVIIPVSFGCSGGCGGGGVIQSGVRVYKTVAWLQAPTLAQVVEAYPAKARQDQMQSGLVSLNCGIGRASQLVNCKPITENPSNKGLAAAALKLSQDFKAPLKDSSGALMSGGFVSLNFAFAQRLLDDPKAVLGKPAIVETAPADVIAAAFPAKAKAANAPYGQVVVKCVVGEAGGLTSCAVQSETPTGLDFGAGAVEIASHTRVGLWGDDGLPTLGATMVVAVPMGSEPSGKESAETLSRTATNALGSQDVDSALKIVQTLLERFPADRIGAGLLDQIEETYNAQKQYEKALKVLDLEIARYPPNARAWGSRCRLKATRNIQTETALADCDEGLRRAPKDAELLSRRGFANLKAGNTAAALTDYEAALANGPDTAEILFGRGVAKSRLGDQAGGKADIAAARKLDADIAKTFADFGVKL